MNIFTGMNNFIKEMLDPNGKISAKRFWGGVIITNCLAMMWVEDNKDNLIIGVLIYGVALLGAGILEGITNKKKEGDGGK